MLPDPNNSKKASAAENFCVRHTRTLGGRSFGRSFFLSSLTLILLLWPLHAGAQPATPPTSKRVLIITGADPNQPGFSIITRSIQSTIRDRSPSRVEFLYELQQGLLDDPELKTGDEALISYLKQKYAGQKIDLILMMVARRFRTLSEKDPSRFTDIPKSFY